jgi:hypothetical protein
MCINGKVIIFKMVKRCDDGVKRFPGVSLQSAPTQNCWNGPLPTGSGDKTLPGSPPHCPSRGD